MFDLENAIADWRRQMLAAGIQTPVPLEELESLSVGLWPLFARFLPLDGAFRLPYNIEGDWIRNEK